MDERTHEFFKCMTKQTFKWSEHQMNHGQSQKTNGSVIRSLKPNECDDDDLSFRGEAENENSRI